MGWRCGGLRWAEGAPVLVWRRVGEDRAERRESALSYGRALGFRVLGARHCVGARGHSCPLGATVPARGTGGLCPECARLDRAHSVAADTAADDPRTFRVYLAWFGPGLVKVGITAEERGAARLLEQGAVAFSWLGRGPLMSARRAEELLRTALGVPDRIPYARKRAIRSELPVRAERAAETARAHARAVALADWPTALERLECAVVDHAEVFGLAGAPAPAPVTGVVTELVDGGVVAGRLVAAAGPDLHLAMDEGGTVVLDTRLMTGWELAAVRPADVPAPAPPPPGGPAAGTSAAGPTAVGPSATVATVVTAMTVPVRDVRPGDVQEGLF
ncbi:DUF2797 domain-containing protein [Streptomyces sp. NPDC004749]